MKKKVLIGLGALALLTVLSLNVTLVKNSHDINLSLGTVLSFASDAYESGAGGGGLGCYNGYSYDCHSWSALSISFSAGTGYCCNFTGVYGPPYYCTERSCDEAFTQRRCVQ